jgi:predicted nucleic acid-binding protein
MISVLIDTNVILDYAEEREGFFEAAKNVLEAIKHREMKACISASAVTDIYYFLRKHYKERGIAISLLKKLIRTLEIIMVDRQTIETAIESEMFDFEDAVQAAAAKNFGIDIIITRDTMGFSNSGLQVYSPEEFLEEIQQ